MTAPSAISIALPLLRSLRAKPFVGAVVGCFERACNLADDHGRVVALALPALGNGPFSILVDTEARRLRELKPGQPAYLDARHIVVGNWQLALASARIWNATLPTNKRFQIESAIAPILQLYQRWPVCGADIPAAAAMERLLARGARALGEALARKGDVTEAARQLAGLGYGLTPAGDDYLIGTMAALWLRGDYERASAIGHCAAPHTTALSRAFLEAAAQRQFTEPWHHLAHALACESAAACESALGRIAEIGASSGRDALAGFAACALN
jgi:hypothetical protein